MADGSEYYVEQPEKMWRSSFNKQQHPDPQSRTKNVIPRNRLVQKKGRYFTTDTSDKQRQSEIQQQTDRDLRQAHPIIGKVDEGHSKKKQRFLGKNA